MTYKIGTGVRIATYPLGGGTDWSEKGKIVRHHPSWKGREHEIPHGYHTVKYDDGGKLMIHESHLQAQHQRSSDRHGTSVPMLRKMLGDLI